MTLFEIVKASILKNKKLRESGQYTGVPFPFKRMSEYVPSLDKGMSIGILGSTGSGKSRLSRYLGIYNVYDFYKKTGYKVKIIVFALEDDVKRVYKAILCRYLWREKGIKISLQELDSKGDRILPDFIIEEIEKAEEYFKEFESIVTIVNGISEPQEIYKFCEKHAYHVGKDIPYKVEIDGRFVEQSMYESDYHTFVIIDNFANIDSGKEHGTDREAIVDLARKYIREKLCNYFNFTVIQVLQNDFQSERASYSTSGKMMVSKLEPSLSSIGEAKTVSRSQTLIFSLFNPSKYELLTYPEVSQENADKAYNIEILGNRFRSFKIIKSNDSDMGPRIGLLFDAIAEDWEELPPPTDEMMKGYYEKFKGNKFTKSKGVLVFEEDYKEDDYEAPF